EPEPLALADREGVGAVVLAQDGAVGVDDLARPGTEPVTQETSRVPVGDETDVVRVRLGGHAQAPLGGLGANSVLGGGVPEWEEGASETLRTHHGEDVGLVLGGVRGAMELT